MASLVLGLTLGLAASARAGGDVSLADLKAATRTLGFLQVPPRSGNFSIGVLYAAAAPGARAQAQLAADRIRTLPGPSNNLLKAEAIATGDLAGHADSLDALYLVPGTADTVIAEMARRRHLLVISDDPACLEQNSCMLAVRDTGRVEIILNSAFAQSAGVSFSPVFAMMVKRK